MDYTNKIDKKRLSIIIIIIILAVVNIYFGVVYFLNRAELLEVRQQLKTQQANEKVLFFAKLFVDKVLLANGAVSWEDRLNLENAVRDINNKEIFSKWEEFTNTKTDRESQTAVGNLLKLLFARIF
ncbi:MAG: hypothetical protein AAB352_01950 [Patescibacteria group bacterium]